MGQSISKILKTSDLKELDHNLR